MQNFYYFPLYVDQMPGKDISNLVRDIFSGSAFICTFGYILFIVTGILWKLHIKIVITEEGGSTNESFRCYSIGFDDDIFHC